MKKLFKRMALPTLLIFALSASALHAMASEASKARFAPYDIELLFGDPAGLDVISTEEVAEIIIDVFNEEFSDLEEDWMTWNGVTFEMAFFPDMVWEDEQGETSVIHLWSGQIALVPDERLETDDIYFTFLFNMNAETGEMLGMLYNNPLYPIATEGVDEILEHDEKDPEDMPEENTPKTDIPEIGDNVDVPMDVEITPDCLPNGVVEE